MSWMEEFMEGDDVKVSYMFGIKGFWFWIQGEIVPATVLPMIAQVGLIFDRMALQAGGVSLTRWGQKSFLWWSRVRLKAGHIDVLQMEYALLWRIRFALCKYDIVQYFGASALVWAVEMFFIHISSACVHSVYRWFCDCLQGLDIKNGKLGHERLKTGLEHITSVIWWDKFWSLWCHSNSFSIQEEVVRDYIWR